MLRAQSCVRTVTHDGIVQFPASNVQLVLARLLSKTFRTYSDMVKLHIKPALGALQLEKLTPEVVQAFLNDKLGSALCPHCKTSINAARMPAHIAERHASAKAAAFRSLGAKTVTHIRATLPWRWP